MLTSESCDLEKLEKDIEKIKRLARKGICRNSWTRDSIHERELDRLEAIKEFIETGVKFEETTDGILLVEDKFLFALRSFKWRVKGRNKWYRSGGPKSFVNRFVNKD